MKYNATGGGWSKKLTEAIEAAQDGDVIVVGSEAVAQLGADARDEIAPGKKLKFEISSELPPNIPKWGAK